MSNRDNAIRRIKRYITASIFLAVLVSITMVYNIISKKYTMIGLNVVTLMLFVANILQLLKNKKKLEE